MTTACFAAVLFLLPTKSWGATTSSVPAPVETSPPWPETKPDFELANILAGFTLTVNAAEVRKMELPIEPIIRRMEEIDVWPDFIGWNSCEPIAGVTFAGTVVKAFIKPTVLDFWDNGGSDRKSFRSRWAAEQGKARRPKVTAKNIFAELRETFWRAINLVNCPQYLSSNQSSQALILSSFCLALSETEKPSRMIKKLLASLGAFRKLIGQWISSLAAVTGFTNTNDHLVELNKPTDPVEQVNRYERVILAWIIGAIGCLSGLGYLVYKLKETMSGWFTSKKPKPPSAPQPPSSSQRGKNQNGVALAAPANSHSSSSKNGEIPIAGYGIVRGYATGKLALDADTCQKYLLEGYDVILIMFDDKLPPNNAHLLADGVVTTEEVGSELVKSRLARRKFCICRAKVQIVPGMRAVMIDHHILKEGEMVLVKGDDHECSCQFVQLTVH